MKICKFKSLISIIAAISVIFTILSAAFVVSADEALITVDPVEVGDQSITVHCGATGTKDWFVVSKKGGTYSERLGNYDYCIANGTVTHALKAPIVAGEYEVILLLNDGYTEGGRFGFTVGDLANEPIFSKETYYSTEKIEVNWAAVPSTVGWAAVYPKGYTDQYNYCDYISNGDAAFPSGISSRYNGYTWPLDAGEYTAVFYEGNGYTVNQAIDFTVVVPTITVTNSSVYLNHSTTVKIEVSGGLTPNTWHRVRLYKAKEGMTTENSGFGNYGVTFTNEYLIGDAAGITTDENGAGSATETLHQIITEPGVYAYTIMENWDTKAIAFIEVMDAATVSLSRTSVPCGANITLALKVTAGAEGLEPNTTYQARLYKGYNGYTGFGSGDVNYSAGEIAQGASITTDENGAAFVLQNAHIKSITEPGKYAYCIMDSQFNTYARVFFEVTDASEPIPEDVPSITLDKMSVTVGSTDELTLSVSNALELGLTSKYYYVRLYSAKSDFGIDDSGFNSNGIDFSSSLGDGNGITLDENGSGSAAQSLHTDKITEPGIYVYALMDGWNTVGRVFFEVTKKPGDVNNDGVIDIRDLINLKKMYEEIIDFDISGDVNGDGALDALDLVELRKILLSLN